MSLLLDPIIHALKQAVTEPRHSFENTKSRVTRTLLRPAAFLLGGEALIVSLLGAIKLFKIQTGTTIVELVGAASENMLLLALMVIVSYLATLGANLFSEHLKRKSLERIIELASEINKNENYQTLLAEYKIYIRAGQYEEARAIAAWILRRYPEEAERDPDLVRLIAKDIPKFHGFMPETIPVQERDRIPPPE